MQQSVHSQPIPSKSLAHDRSSERTGSEVLTWCVFFAAHIPLALVMKQFALLATLHAGVTLGVGLWCAAISRKSELVAYVSAYIAGAEVLWRMTSAQVFGEFGKYATVAVLIIAIVRFHKLAGARLPLVYFILLLPSAILTISALSSAGARDQISFNLSGPFALTICAWYFSRLPLSPAQLHRLMLTLIGPVIAIATIAVYSTLTADYATIDFTQESNYITSGGFGPNQVSNMLGLGAMLAFIYVFQSRQSAVLRLLMFGGVITFGAVSALTFSRSGLYNAGAAALVIVLFSAREVRTLMRLLVVAGLLYLVASAVIIPGLEQFTQGAISQRFQDVSIGQRVDIAQADLKIWEDNFLFGVGPGLAKEQRHLASGPAAAHTELSRLLAEHGILGLLALALLAAMAFRNIARVETSSDKGLVAGLLVWTLFFFLNSAMRMVAPSFIFGLTFAIAASSPPRGEAKEDILLGLHMTHDA